MELCPDIPPLATAWKSKCGGRRRALVTWAPLFQDTPLETFWGRSFRLLRVRERKAGTLGLE